MEIWKVDDFTVLCQKQRYLPSIISYRLQSFIPVKSASVSMLQQAPQVPTKSKWENDEKSRWDIHRIRVALYDKALQQNLHHPSRVISYFIYPEFQLRRVTVSNDIDRNGTECIDGQFETIFCDVPRDGSFAHGKMGRSWTYGHLNRRSELKQQLNNLTNLVKHMKFAK